VPSLILHYRKGEWVEVGISLVVYLTVSFTLAFGLIHFIMNQCCKVNYLQKVREIERHLQRSICDIHFLDSYKRIYSFDLLEPQPPSI